ncbi:YbaB/EbfC family nucleoid-associated protein [Patescibacteria group bacterium]|nr:YbaB/EbfC family nucleoid-associated protein [Patescibacteria group bacterium]MBU1663515.1 YbaB/EbfC family nucleoid-associated protein [Patescibacteria group bacterium]MBU1933777.1 YbaB/EbfC family nucleoid-associated protein [Patescibacteria group bacterium]MBU2007831.1 YbaB/EbfC family nucleoid-associated protein [Patescibacteria group bacterium]MBU2233254.1 YbaB/EbfC family nucleoid-associated protein [Patescibacteria group bacterium]
MFNKLKQFKDLRNQAKALQNALAQESVEYEKSGIKITMNGNMEITSIIIDSNVSADKLTGILTAVINETIKRAQRVMGKKVQEMGGISGITNI